MELSRLNFGKEWCKYVQNALQLIRNLSPSDLVANDQNLHHAAAFSAHMGYEPCEKLVKCATIGRMWANYGHSLAITIAIVWPSFGHFFCSSTR